MDGARREIGRQADALEQGGDAARTLAAGGDAVNAQGVVEHAGHGGARVEGGKRILEHHLQTRAPSAQGSAIQGQEIIAFEFDAARVRLDQPQHQPRDRRLAAAGRSGQRQRFAGFDVEGDIIDGRDGSCRRDGIVW